ncbi:hypothetical protein INT47_000967 [Mucor saturninus]|uniref:CUE domain-containing protein n=1 Tax=Mucor saturninus TaxID=64648 RepID=A0A8H7RRA1_9FUNG|nr:hypothetical protein INT47_000967 [Mucor saturninus]
MLSFIPFIPHDTKGVNEAVWQTARRSWLTNLTELLNMQDAVFVKQVSSNTTLATFIDQVFNEQMDNDTAPVDTLLIKYIFLLYARLSSLAPTHDLLNIQRLCSFVIVYGYSNISQVRRIVANAVNESESLEQNLLATMGMLIDSIQSMPNSLKNSITAETLDRAYVLVRVLDSLLSSTVQLTFIKSSFDTLDQVLIDCYRDLIPTLKKAVECDESNKTRAYLIKLSLVSSFNSYADMHFFTPFGYITSPEDHHQLEKYETTASTDSVLDWMSEKILGYIEHSGLESTCAAFEDGPVIMDWEVEYNITEKLDYINKTSFSGEDERIEFLKLSMEQVRDSNNGTSDWGSALKTRAKPAINGKASAKDKSVVFENVERTSKISQIHDLFPDFGDGFIEACLEANNDDVEVVIMQFLEENLPASVAGLDRSMERKPLKSATETVAQLAHLEGDAAAKDAQIQQAIEHESVLSSRRNVYDNDEFDIFTHRTVDTSKVYTGKKDKGNADSLLDDKSFIQSEKKNVLQRVVDMYDDDYDDTYDEINDAGAPSTLDGDSAVDIVKKKQELLDPGIQNESLLVHSFTENPELFGRNGTARKSTKRAELRKRTEMTDEQLEGWAIMFNRNPRKDRILDKYMLFDGNQTKVTDEVTQAQKQALKKENKKPPISEAKDRSYKDKNKARFGNHNRKANRDKKVAKAGPPPS